MGLQHKIYEFLGERIINIGLISGRKSGPDYIILFFESGSLILLNDVDMDWTRRYIRTDDHLESYKGSILIDYEVRDIGTVSKNESMQHDIQFLVIVTSLGNITFSSHNIHNGYYSGFNLIAKLIKNDKT